MGTLLMDAGSQWSEYHICYISLICRNTYGTSTPPPLPILGRSCEVVMMLVFACYLILILALSRPM